MPSPTRRHIEMEHRHGTRRYHELPVVLTRGAGIYLYDVRGRRYMDMLSVCSALGPGHNHPRIVSAARAQLGRLALTSRSFHNDRLGPLLHRLCRLAAMERAVLMSTGAEAVEIAIKAMRLWGYRIKGIARDKAVILVADGNFHGRTTTLAGLSCDPLCSNGYGPATPGFETVPYGDAAAMETAASRKEVCGFLVEPIQAEAGVRLPPPGYLRRVRDICTRRKVLFCADEVQTGLGRTGAMFCVDHEEVRPDLLVLGKALSGGLYPVSALVARAGILDLFEPGAHCSTYGGNPIACAVAMAALDVVERERLPARAAEMGAYLLGRLRALRHPKLREARGRGLLLAMEFKEPDGSVGRRFCELLFKRGLLTKVSHETVVRVQPPLIITRGQIDLAFRAITGALEEL